MSDAKSRPDLSGILEQRRRELSDRPDVSARMRKLSASNSRNPLPPTPRKRPTMLRMLLVGLAPSPRQSRSPAASGSATN
jgi:hypothetical protein